MNPDNNLKIEIFKSDEDAKHRISSPKEIEFLLRNIATKNARVALYYMDSDRFILTTLLGVSDRGIWVEQCPQNELNQEILNSDLLTFVSSHLRVKVQFETGHPEPQQYEDKIAFFLPMPTSLLRLQRREFFRLATQEINPLKCIIPLGHPHPRINEVTIMDISVGGAALTCAEDDTELVPGETYDDCCINLPGFGSITGTLVVRNWAILTSADGQNYKRAGCELQNMDNPSISLLNRYIMHMQRAR